MPVVWSIHVGGSPRSLRSAACVGVDELGKVYACQIVAFGMYRYPLADYGSV